jgi:hypothetical protein
VFEVSNLVRADGDRFVRLEQGEQGVGEDHCRTTDSGQRDSIGDRTAPEIEVFEAWNLDPGRGRQRGEARHKGRVLDRPRT